MAIFYLVIAIIVLLSVTATISAFIATWPRTGQLFRYKAEAAIFIFVIVAGIYYTASGINNFVNEKLEHHIEQER